MPKRSDPGEQTWEELRARVVGLGERSFRKSYYPQLRARIDDLSRYRALLDQITEGVLLARATDDVVVYANASATRLLGREAPPERWPEAFPAPFVRALRAAFAEESLEPVRLEQEGSTVVEVAPSLIRLGEEPYVVLLVRDIAGRLEQERRIRLLSRTLEQSPVSVVILDDALRVEYVNERFISSTGFDLEDLRGLRLDELPTGRRRQDSLQDAYARLLTGESWEGEVRTYRSDGSSFWEQATFSPVLSEAGQTTHYVVFKEDVTERRQARERIRHLAFYDPLTGLPNRRLLFEALGEALSPHAGATVVAVHFLDLDHFKDVNDLHGHPIGDQLLRGVAERLTQVVRDGDLVARLGGDELAVLQTDASERSAVEALARRLLEVLERPFRIAGTEVQTGASVGVALARPGEVSPETLMQWADLALYQVKRQGRGVYCFYSDRIGVRAHERASLSQELDAASFDRELFVEYQPQFSLQDRGVIGFEALVRWMHPTRGRLAPADFIPVAEEHGQICRLGAWVLERACRDAVVLIEAGVEFERIAVNVSVHQFRRGRLAEVVEDTLRRTGLPADHLQLEITESVLMDDVQNVRPVIEQLRALGVSFAIDDFGTGFSSLLTLKRLSIDTLKVAQEFVRDMLVDLGDDKIVRASIELARQLGLTAVAEGAETAQHISALEALGCDEVQGFALGRPMRAEALLEDPRVRPLRRA